LGANGTVYALAVQSDGRILIGGDFTQVNTNNVGHIARLNVDGSVDLTFTNASRLLCASAFSVSDWMLTGRNSPG